MIPMAEFANQACKSKNLKWSLGDEFVWTADVYLKTFDIVSNVKVPAFEAWEHCDRPLNVDGFHDLLTITPPGQPGAPVPCGLPVFPRR